MARNTIKFTISAEDTVVNDTVKIVASISGMVTRESTEEKLRAAIRGMMDRFITAKWQFAGMTRSAHESGLEEIKLVASARVPEAENRALDKRRIEASKPDEGMTIYHVQSDTSFPASLVAKTEQKLRLDIIAKAKDHAKEIGDAMGQPFHVAAIKYGADPQQRHHANQYMSSSAASVKTPYGSGFAADSSDDDAIGNAQKFTMVATVTLAPTTA